MEPFQFKNTHTFSEEEYRDIHRLLETKKGRLRGKIITAILTVACFFSPYTLLLGIVLVILFLLDRFKSGIVTKAFDNAHRESKLLKLKLTYGVSNNYLTLEGKGVSLKIGWNMIKVWELKERWLVISADQLPSFYLDIEKLKEKNLLLKVLSLCQKHGVMFDSKLNKERYNKTVQAMSANAAIA